MTPGRGEVWLADLGSTQGSEQAGVRPVVVLQDNSLNRVTTTVITIPLTTNLRRASLPSCLLIKQGEGNLERDSVALCHQIRVLDTGRLTRRLGMLSDQVVRNLEVRMLFTLGF